MLISLIFVYVYFVIYLSVDLFCRFDLSSSLHNHEKVLKCGLLMINFDEFDHPEVIPSS